MPACKPALVVSQLHFGEIIKGNTMNVLNILATIIASVKAVEAIVNTPNADGTINKPTGQEKLDAAIAMIEAVEGTVLPMLPAVKAMIGSLVALFNLRGLFHKSA
jgi:hypothetical protein